MFSGYLGGACGPYLRAEVMDVGVASCSTSKLHIIAQFIFNGLCEDMTHGSLVGNVSITMLGRPIS